MSDYDFGGGDTFDYDFGGDGGGDVNETDYGDGGGGEAPLSPVDYDMEAQSEYVGYDYADNDQDEDEEDDGDQPDRVEERFVQADGTVVIRITHMKKKKKKQKTKQKKTKKNPTAAAPPNTVKVTTTAVVSSIPPGAIVTGRWDAHLCGCFDHCMPNLFMVLLCPCVSIAQISSRLGFPYTTNVTIYAVVIAIEYACWVAMATNMKQTAYSSRYSYDYSSDQYRYSTYAYSSNRVPIWGYVAVGVSIVLCIALWQLRLKVRQKFAIPGSQCDDLCVSCCCPWCSLAQMATHVKSFKSGSCDFGPPDELHAYIQ